MYGTEAKLDQSRYSEISTSIANILADDELGYIYAFPDKRLYTPVEDPSTFIHDAWGAYEGDIGVYVHTPFCTPKPPPSETRTLLKDHEVPADGRDHLCGYCNLFTVVAPGAPNWFTNSLNTEIDLYRPVFEGKDMSPTSLYFGGGTPSLIPAEDIANVVANIEGIFGPIPQDKERAIECTPDSVDHETLSALRKIGFNRVSIGVQTFDEGVLHYTGRNYDPRLGYEAIRDALRVGFPNVNGDIIIGLPSSTRAVFLTDIATMRELAPHTITLYQDMTRPVTRFGKMEEFGILPKVSQQDIYEWSNIADEQLRSDGYTRQTLTCWSRGGRGYQQGDDIYNRVPIIGFGPGARSYGPNAHYSTEYTVSTKLINYLISRWRHNVDQGQFPDISGYLLNGDVKTRGDVIFGLMSDQGLSNATVISKFSEELALLRDAGMATKDNGVWRYTEAGKAHSGALSSIFFGSEITTQLASYQHK